MKVKFGGDWARLEKHRKMGGKAESIHKPHGSQRVPESFTQPVEFMNNLCLILFTGGHF